MMIIRPPLRIDYASVASSTYALLCKLRCLSVASFLTPTEFQQPFCVLFLLELDFRAGVS